MFESLVVCAVNYGEAVVRAKATALFPEVIPAPSPATMDSLMRLQTLMADLPEVPLPTEHLLHGGMYARTIRRGPGVVAVGSLILRATILIVSGPCTLVTGESRLDLHGYNVLPGLAGRKQLSLTHGAVEMTMIFPTSAKTVEEAENEIFAEADQLISRKDGSRDQVTITGH